MSRRRLAAAALVGLAAGPSALGAQDPEHAPIQDNSFLLEEAYNQESGVVQHISTFSHAGGGVWAFTFTQEWPLGGIAHQLSYALPFLDAGAGSGIGDVAVNYRHQLIGNPEARLLVAPRVSLLLPTGSIEGARGTGGAGVAVNLPVSAVVSRSVVTHWNLGATFTPAARGPLDARASTAAFNAGASAVWLLRPWLNLLVEGIWGSGEEVTGEGRAMRFERAFVNPGIRVAFDAGSVQVVPGAGYTIGVGPSRGEDALFLYLSLEHAFRR